MASLTGTGTLIRLILRRDRIRLALFIALPVLIVASQTTAFQELYPTVEARLTFTQQSNGNPATLGMLGPIFASSLGSLVAWRVGVMGMIFAGIPSVLLVIRHTRAEEESGRRELLSSTPAGRNAPLTAALAAVFGANLTLAAAVTIVLLAFGLPAAGSLALGLSFAGAGWMCAAIGGRGCPGERERWHGEGHLSDGLHRPFSTSHRRRRGWSRERLRVALVALAAQLDPPDPPLRRREVVGLRPRPGLHRRAGRRGLRALRGPRPGRWLPAATARTGAGRSGAAQPAHPGMAATQEHAAVLHRRVRARRRLGGLGRPDLHGASGRHATGGDFLDFAGAADVGEAFVSLIVYALSISLVSAYAIMAVLRLRSEETSGHADSLLSGPTSRLRWASSHLLIAALGPVVLLAALGLSAGLTYSLVSGDVAGELPRILGSTMAALPAVWVMAALATAAYGLFPRFAALVGWGALGVFLLIELGWETQQISDAVFAVSPFSHVHPSTEVGPFTLLSLTAVAAVLAAGGLLGLRKRDFG